MSTGSTLADGTITASVVVGPSVKDLIASVVGDDSLVTADAAKLRADTATDQEAHGTLSQILTQKGPFAVLVPNADGGQSVVVYRAGPDGKDIATDPPVPLAT